jgi:hypothetical protein
VTLSGQAAGNTAATDFGVQRVVGSLEVTSVSGSPTSFSIQLQGSLDGTNFFNLGTALTAAGTSTTSTSLGFRSLRANVSVTGGSSPTATLKLAGT